MRFIVDTKNLATAGTAVQFAALNLRCKALTFHARSTNTGQVFIGGAGVLATAGYELTANVAYSVTLGEGSDMLSDYYMNASSTTQSCDVWALVES